MKSRPIWSNNLICYLALGFSNCFQGSTSTVSPLRFNDVQVFGTHNSYHLPPPQQVQQLLSSATVQSLIGNKSYLLPAAWQYSQPTLGLQLDLGMRELEFDTNYDPSGGLFAGSAGLEIAGVDGRLTGQGYAQPGAKVLHVADVDYVSSCVLFTECLSEVQRWSTAHPLHFPITIFVDVKSEGVGSFVGPSAMHVLDSMLAASPVPGPHKLAQPLPLTTEVLRGVEADILSVFRLSQIITPDIVRGAAPNLAAAVLLPRGQWPTVESMLGRFLFCLVPGNQDLYYQLHPRLGGGLMFVSGFPADAANDTNIVILQMLDGLLPGGRGTPSDALLFQSWTAQVNEQITRINDFVQQGYLVKAYADSGTIEPRSGFMARRDQLLQSGAQLILTDFPVASSTFATSYKVGFPGGIAARCNPLRRSDALQQDGGNASLTSRQANCPQPGGWVM